MAAPSGITWGSIANGYGRIGIYATTSNTNDVTTVTAEVWFWTKYSCSDTNNTFYFDFASSASTSKGKVSINTTVDSGGGWSTSNQVKIGTYTYSYSRTKSAQTKHCSAKLSGIEVLNGSSVTCSVSVTVPAKPSYTITYNANGGSSTPNKQTKWYAEPINLSGAISRTGYTFQGWNTKADGSGTNYAAGAQYTGNASVTLYAKWKIVTYTIKYDANGGTGTTPSSQTKNYGTDITLSTGSGLTRTNYNFKGWATSSTGGVAYAPGAKYSTNAATTLYAVWELAYYPPVISNLKVTRCNSDGTTNETGTYCKLTFKWECCQLVGTNYISSAAYKIADGTQTEITVSSTATSGNVSIVIGGSLSVDSSYSITVIANDSKSGSTSVISTLPATKFPIDFKKGGNGVAFGKPATRNNTVEFGFDACGKVMGLGTLPQLVSNEDLNDYKSIGCWAVYSTSSSKTIANIPVQSPGRLEVICGLGNGHITGTYAHLIQRYTVFNGEVYQRHVRTLGTADVWTYGEWYKPNLTSDISSHLYGGNKLLWSGGAYMTADQTITLSEAVSKQLHGIVLGFSYRDNSEGGSGTTDSHWHQFFVPKWFVATYPGKSSIFNLSMANYNTMGTKCLHISDTTIVGYSGNKTNTTSNSGITMKNDYWVLRYVLGV